VTSTPLPPKRRSAALLAVLVAVAFLAGLYYTIRFGGWAMEVDAARQALAADGVLATGRLAHPRAYGNGYEYAAQLALASLVTGLPLQPVQLASSLSVFILVLVAFVTYREFLDSAAWAALTVLLLLLQPDFLFYVLRGSHERNTWTFALLMLFLLLRSQRYAQKPARLLIYVALFYLTFWAMAASNLYFATTFTSAILIGLVAGWVLQRRGARDRAQGENRATVLRRLVTISVACLAMVYLFINYAYRPALTSYYYFRSLADRVGLVTLGAEAVAAPVGYAALGHVWRSSGIYLGLTGLQWLIAIASLVAWALEIPRLRTADYKRWLLWLLYTAFGALLAFGVFADFAGFLSANMQVRMFTPFALFSSALVAGLIRRGYLALDARGRRLAAIGATGLAVYAALAAAMKVSNDPTIGNLWLFYSPAEADAAAWAEAHVQDEIWVDTWDHLANALEFRAGYGSAGQYTWGVLPSPAPYTLISELTRLRANRVGLSLPETRDQNRVYDNGTAQIYDRRALTPYQR
jgi:hypothetical protein